MFGACGTLFGHGRGEDKAAGEEPGRYGGWVFGVRRPLRFMARSLGLSEQQMTELATILDDLKMERDQAAVDRRRSIAAFADALSAQTFDEEPVKKAAHERVRSAERVADAVVRALARTHAILDDEQRKRLAYLMRSGVLTI